MKDLPGYLQPFVLTVEGAADLRIERVGDLDFYRPASTARTGAILLVHGGPGPADLEVQPRDWPVYQGYAKAIAQRGLVAVTVDHSLIRGYDQLTAAADDVEAAVGILRADPQVDQGKVGLWFFSGSGLLAGEWLDSRPDWLRWIALTYPCVATPPGVDELVSAAEVIGKHKDLPVLLTRVGREREALAGPVAEFVSAGGAALDIIDVPKGQHGFDMLDHTEESRAAVTKALDWAIAHLGEEPAGQLPIPAVTTTSDPIPATTIPAPPRQPATKVAATPTPAAKTTKPRTPAAPATPATPAEPASQPATAEAAAAQAAPTEATATTSAPAQAAPAAAPVPQQADSPAARVVGREHAAYEAHDLEAFLAMYSPTAQLQLEDGTVMRGRRSLREYYQPRFDAGQCKTELVQRMLVGEWVVERSIVHDSDRGPTPTIGLYRAQDGLIVEVRFLA
ncbi:nuclear transport factor 2 family protein [Kribbella sp. VKM Ac-2568]|uniref:nuclear transport factor 2 family protein n=1 Tax=Kribbella sp. VKM Ac-2568 TaxID=2512219 RepID=UPI001044D5B1|nr:nuclear transport factor 2 family protein [Kribbella sp. VKM Ac-2568]